MKFIKKNLDRILLFIVLFILIFLILQYIFNLLNLTDNTSENVMSDEIPSYNYKLYNDDTKIYYNNFKNLKQILSNEEIDENEYAKSIALLFTIDFYTLSNKNTNMDIGGVQYLSSQIKENFILKATDTLYKYVENNVYGDRKQELPTVSNAFINSIDVVSFKHDSIDDTNAYEVSVSLEYEKDMGYPTNLALTIIHENNKLAMVEIKNTD